MASLLLGGWAIGKAQTCAHVSSAKRWTEGKSFMVQDVQVFTGRDTILLQHQDVLVVDGKIQAIRPTGGAAPTGMPVFRSDNPAATLMPGFIDSHVHLTASGAVPWAKAKTDIRQNAATMLEAGVTTVYDLGGVSSKLEAAEGQINAGKWQGPRILHTHAPITTPGGHPIPAIQALLPKAAGKFVAKMIPQVGDPSEAAGVVDKTLAQKVDFVKVICDSFAPGYPEMSDAVLQALVNAAHARKQRVFVHIASTRNALSAVRAGADVLAHGPYRSRLTPADAQAIGRSGIPMIYTLAACHGVTAMMQGAYQPDSLDQRYNGACLLEPVTGAAGKQFADQPVLGGFGQEVLAHAPYQAENIRLLHENGQRFLIGTDSPIPGAYAGSAVHQEMAQLHAAGVPAGEVLLGATGWAAQALYDQPTFGFVEVGMDADLVVLDGNPLEDIGVTSHLLLVVQQGRAYTVAAQ
jgi:imidazolonepropionase-like amidohydrolase